MSEAFMPDLMLFFFFLMIRRPPRSTLFPYTDALPISLGHYKLMDIDLHTLHLLMHTERSEEHTSELQSPDHLVCRLLLEKKKSRYRRCHRSRNRRRATAQLPRL